MDNPQTRPHKGDILIVDDDLSNLKFLSAMLTAEGYEVRGVTDGPMALTAIKTQPPELIFLDIRMPGMDGFEVCRKIKSEGTLSDLPILFLSAIDEIDDKIKAFKAGAIDYITKPFQVEEVKARVETHITLSRLNRSLDQQVQDRTAKLKKSEESLAEQLKFERLISEIAARMAQVQPVDLKAEIDETLQLIGRLLHAERAFFAQFSKDGKRLVFKNFWAAEGVRPQSKIFGMDLAADFPWLAETIRSGRIINIGPGLKGFPEEARELRRQLERDGINSGCVVPVTVQGRSIGLLGVDTVIQPREYPALLVDRLRHLADVIGSTLVRIRVQKKLEQYRHIVESTTSIVGLVDRNYVYQYVNNAYPSVFQKKRQEIIGNTVADLVGQERFNKEFRTHYDRCFSGEEVSFQSWNNLPGLGMRFLDVLYSPFFDSDEKVSAVVVSAHDITEIKRLEIKLNDSEERFRAFMDNIPASIYIKDDNDVHVYANPEAFKKTRKKPDELIGMTSRDIWPPDVADRLIELDRQVRDGNFPRITEEWQNTEEGDTEWRRDIKFPIQLESGEKLLGGIAIDITETKKSEQRLREAYTEIEQLKQKLEQENIYLREEIELRHRHEEIIGKSEPVLEMLASAEQVAETDATVLILGETGTGKELLANAIHRLSRRKDNTMIKVNCAALPETLIESELFGREKGAYTGAMSRQVGRFEIANGSTLFLDEIGEMPLELQAKLLRVLQEGQFERLGSPKTVSTNVRIITSTNRDLAKNVREGKFREDLYYRLNVFRITVPPLRDRVEDIPLLVWAFVKEYENSMGKTIHTIPRKSIEMLQKYAWPGNIRELKNLVENAMIVTKEKTLHMIPPVDPTFTVRKAIKLKDVERDHIKNILKKTSWRVSGKNGAAELLGLKPTTLASRMKKLGISRPR